jgi:hypothetical protein
VTEPEEEDFATMFEASERSRQLKRGQTVEGVIVAIGAETALVDVGGKSEAVIDVKELKDDDGNLEVVVGDRIQATVVPGAGRLTLSRRLAMGAATARQLEDAFQAGLPVEGRVERSAKADTRYASRASAPSAPSLRSTSSAIPIRRSTKGASTSSASSNTRKAARTSSCRGVRCSSRSSRPTPPACGARSSKAR